MAEEEKDAKAKGAPAENVEQAPQRVEQDQTRPEGEARPATAPIAPGGQTTGTVPPNPGPAGAPFPSTETPTAVDPRRAVEERARMERERLADPRRRGYVEK